ncbi:3-hydroxybutyrate dehydrogenase [Curvivirga sp.]|uniref:3-hydroxybutyrate dehydrogenase n=1 Tax=Curvivirga sp. TaxID=2856848 RepID=UPI003B5B69A3
MIDLRDKVAVVTGSTSGIGLAMAQGLAAQGCNVMLNGFGDEDKIEQIRASMEKDHNVKVSYSSANMAKPDEIRTLIQETVDTFGSLNILINNAGIQRVHPIEDFPEQDWDDIIAINLSSVFHTMKAAVPHMRQADWGRIINTASVHGLVGSVHKAAYVAAKHGVVGMTKVVALETAEDNITCNAICPGWVHTELIDEQIKIRADKLDVSKDEAEKDILREKQPSMNFVKTEDLANLVLFLCSPAANQMTGAELPVDGGWTAQ